MIELRALGNAEIVTDVTTLTPSQEIVFAAALYLVLERGKRVSRTRLASLLWPRVAEKPRAHRLRQTILQLKKLGIVVRADRDTVQLLKHDARSDVDDLRASASLPNACDSLECLPGYNPGCSEPFRDWVDARREEVHAAVTKILITGLGKARIKGDWSLVEAISSQCLVLDPLNEVAILAQAEAAAMRGSKSKAVAILDRYIAEVGSSQSELKLPATLLRRRVVERIPDRPTIISSDPPFIGREAEMEALIRRFESARTGKGSATLLIGEPGIGKSRLSAEVARFAELQGARIQRATCRRHDLDRPLSFFVDIVPELRELPGALGCAPETFTSLKRLTEFEQRPGNDFRSADSEMLFQDLRTALFDLFDSVAEERCLVILIEDVQWLDDASAKILAGMAQWATRKRLFLLLNARPTNNFFSRDADTGCLDTLTLSPLTPAASLALLHSMTFRPDEEPQSGFADWCLAVAEGNPFFLQELTHHWIETRRTYEAPPSVTKVLHERLSGLSREALQVLQTCAVLGEDATLDRVERVLEYQPYQLLSAVEELSKAAMLRSNVGRMDTVAERLRPRHDFLSSASISRLAPVSLAFLHRRSADVLEREFPQDKMPTALLWASANHRHHAGDWGKALALSISCAEHLLEVGLAGEASAAFQKSLDYCVTDEQRLQVLPRLAFASQLNGEWEQTKAALQSCIRLAGKVEPSCTRHNEFELLLFAARHQSALDFSSLLADVLPCVSCLDASPAHRVSAAVIALKIATDMGPAEVLDSIYANVKPLLDDKEVTETSRFEVEMIYRTTRGCEVMPLEALKRFAESARATGGELAYSNALVTASAACRISARYQEGLAFVAQAFEHAITHKRQGRLSRVLVAELRLHLAAGAYDKAEATLARLMECSIHPDDDFAQSELQTYKATIALAKGDVSSASTAFAGVQTVPRNYSARRRANSLAIRLHIRLNEGATQPEIRSLVSELEIEHLRVRGLRGHDFETYALYLGLCSLGDGARALALLTEYLQVHRRSQWPVPDEMQSAINSSVRFGQQNTKAYRPSGPNAEGPAKHSADV